MCGISKKFQYIYTYNKIKLGKINFLFVTFGKFELLS